MIMSQLQESFPINKDPSVTNPSIMQLAENLKEKIWSDMGNKKITNKRLKEAMNNLLDEIEEYELSLEEK